MAKLTTSDLSNLTNETSAVSTINNNFAAVEVALEKTLSRDGTSPNTMGADLDMNSNRIINLPTPIDDQEAANKEYVDDRIAMAEASASAAAASALAADASADSASASASSASASAISADASADAAAASAVLAEAAALPGGAGGAILYKTSALDYAFGWLSTTSFGRSLLSLASAATLRTAVALPTSTVVGRLARYTDTAGAQGQTSGLFEDGSGNVGINTTTPTHQLTVRAVDSNGVTVMNAGESSTRAYIQTRGGATAARRAVVQGWRDTVGAIPLTLQEDGGNVGIGTTTPEGNLHVFKSSAGTVTADVNAHLGVFEAAGSNGLSILVPNISVSKVQFGSPADNVGGVVQYQQSIKTMKIGAGSPAAGGITQLVYDQGQAGLTLNASGNVGVGTATPNQKLDVSNGRVRSSDSVAEFAWLIDMYTSRSGADVTGLIETGVSTNRLTLRTTEASAPILFSPNSTERMRVAANGNVGIGTATEFGSGTGVIGLKDAGVVPSTNPTGASVIYSEGGVPKARSSAGVVGSLVPTWEDHNPTPTPSSGSFTSASATGRKCINGKLATITGVATITTVGTGTGNLLIPLPANAANIAACSVIYASTGQAAGAWVQSGNMTIVPVAALADGQVYYYSATYETV